MKETNRFAVTIVCLLLLLLLFCLLTVSCTNSGEVYNRSAKINEMARYVNEKYGYSMSAADVTFFLEEDYTFHGDFFGFGRTFDLPFVAIFEKDGVAITVTDRHGFLSDDGQMEELNDLLCDYFMDHTGLTGLEYVAIRLAQNPNIPDSALSDILQSHWNEKITPENIERFVATVLEKGSHLEFVFYFREEADRKAQLQRIMDNLKKGTAPESVERIAFYTFTNEDGLKIDSWQRNLDKYFEKGNEPEEFMFTCYYIVNPHELQSFGEQTEHTFGYHVVYQMGRGHDGGFGAYTDSTTQHKFWRIADLSQDPK